MIRIAAVLFLYELKQERLSHETYPTECIELIYSWSHSYRGTWEISHLNKRSKTIELIMDDIKTSGISPGKRSVMFGESQEEIPYICPTKRVSKIKDPPLPLVTPDEVKPIIKIPKSPMGRSVKAMKAKEIATEQAIAHLKEGIYVTKYTLKGIPKLRFIKVSSDGSQLMWKSKTAGFYTKIQLASAKLLVVGPRSRPFERYSWKKGRPWQCLTIHCVDRTVDLEFVTREEFLMWYDGLLHLVPLNSNNKSLAMVNWYRLLFKSVQISLQTQLAVPKVWKIFVTESKLQLAEEGQKMKVALPEHSAQYEMIKPLIELFKKYQE